MLELEQILDAIEDLDDEDLAELQSAVTEEIGEREETLDETIEEEDDEDDEDEEED